MPLTPEDVSNKRFTPVRLREGYDMGEVDSFLDEVEAELVRLIGENDDLRGRLTSAGHGDDLPTAHPAPAQVVDAEDSESTGISATAASAAAAETDDDAPVVTATSTTPPETLKVVTATEASNAAVRLLEIATRNADELVDEARAEADRREAESRATAERLESEAQHRAEVLDAETEERRQELLGALETERQSLNGEIDDLRSFEREYRSRLKSYFEQQLDALDGAETGDQGARTEPAREPGQPAPGRLQSLLGGARDGDSV